jgi:hypothetical protein
MTVILPTLLVCIEFGVAGRQLLGRRRHRRNVDEDIGCDPGVEHMHRKCRRYTSSNSAAT